MAQVSTATWTFTARHAADAARYQLQRDIVIGLLWSRPATQAQFAALRRSTGLDAPVRRLRRAVDRDAPLATLKAAEASLFEKINASRTNVGRGLDAYVRGLFGRYVPWVTQALIQLFVGQMHAYAVGRKLEFRSSATTMVERPNLVITAQATHREARAILRAHYKEAAARYKTGGRSPRKKIASVRRDAAWYFFHIVEKESIRRLAKEYCDSTHQFPSHTGRALVQRGIRETATRLGLPITSK